MSRIKIGDLPEKSKISEEEMKRVSGGASLVEYVQLVALIQVVSIGVLDALGSQANTKLRTSRDPSARATDGRRDGDDE